MKVFNKTRNLEVAGAVRKADTFFTRLFGLIPRRALGPGEGLWLDPCAMIHTCFMRFAIDAVFLDGDLRVVRVCPDMGPWKFSPWVGDAVSVLELASGESAGRIEAGDSLDIV